MRRFGVAIETIDKESSLSFPRRMNGGWLANHPATRMRTVRTLQLFIMGCSQVVRHMVLVHACAGSNPATPATKQADHLVCFFRDRAGTIRTD